MSHINVRMSLTQNQGDVQKGAANVDGIGFDFYREGSVIAIQGGNKDDASYDISSFSLIMKGDLACMHMACLHAKDQAEEWKIVSEPTQEDPPQAEPSSAAPQPEESGPQVAPQVLGSEVSGGPDMANAEEQTPLGDEPTVASDNEEPDKAVPLADKLDVDPLPNP